MRVCYKRQFSARRNVLRRTPTLVFSGGKQQQLKRSEGDDKFFE